jgi:hypothetical protein
MLELAVMEPVWRGVVLMEPACKEMVLYDIES